MTLAALGPFAGLPLMLLALACAVGGLVSRSLIVACLNIACAGAAASAVLLLLGAAHGALALLLVTAAWSPLVVLSAVMLSTRSVAGGARRLAWFSLALAGATLCALLWLLGSAGAAAAAISFRGELALWLSPLVFVTGAACLGLLGFGERGIFASRETERAR